ncbi:MAG: hypothetical protein WBA89_21275 [Microcoleus sp.]
MTWRQEYELQSIDFTTPDWLDRARQHNIGTSSSFRRFNRSDRASVSHE